MLTIGVVGLGHVGTITRDLLKLGAASVVCYDRLSGDPYPSSEFFKCDYVMVCVDTPALSDGRADLNQVRAAFDELPESVPVVLRSTVPPGTCGQLTSRYHHEVVFWPEYLGESQFVSQDWTKFGPGAGFQMLGGEPSIAMDQLTEFLSETLGPEVRIFRTGCLEAELIKYMENCYFAMKITFVNEFRRVAEAIGADWYEVREGWLLDPRVERDHTAAFRSSRGYGGKCLPKDVSAIVSAMTAAGCPMPLMEAVHMTNALATTANSNSRPMRALARPLITDD